MKTILFHVQDDDTLQNGFENAQTIARATGGHLHCLHVVPSSAFIASEGLGGAYGYEQVAAALDARADEVRRIVEEDLANEDISWDYEHVIGDVETTIVRRSALSDLIVTSRAHPRGRKHEDALSRLGQILHGARTPLFIPGDNGKMIDLAGTAVIAWDCSHEAANAVRQSIALLKLASNVRVVRVDEHENGFPDTHLLEYLSRYDIRAELYVEKSKESAVDAILRSHAQQAGNGYLVMGAYSHSRIGEFLFGGVTRSMLKQSPVGLIMAH